MSSEAPLERLIYRSRSTTGDPLLQMDEILRVSIWNNARARVTGVLGHFGAHYVQVLEGPAPGLGALMQQLLADRRHAELSVLSRLTVHRRLFPGWSMARVDIFGGMAPSASVIEDGAALTLRLVELFRRGETAVS